jgi:hypothetical protein
MRTKLIADVLEEREDTYGSYEKVSSTSQIFKDILRDGDSWSKLSYPQREALEMIVSKISRIINGDPTYEDSWVDIIGYTTLVTDKVLKKN